MTGKQIGFETDPSHRSNRGTVAVSSGHIGRRKHHLYNQSLTRSGEFRRGSPRAPDLRLVRLGLMAVRIDNSREGIDWMQAKADLATDAFDNGRSAEALEQSFDRSQHVAFARDGDRLIGMARLLSDGVCNAYLVDVWTMSSYRRQGIGSALVRLLLDEVPGQHVGLQTDDAQSFYSALGFAAQPMFLSKVVGNWLDNDANH